MTLVELLVSLALLTLMTASVAGAVTIGYRTFGPGGATDRQQVATDVSVVQKAMTVDIGRSSCIVVPHSPTNLVYGSCTGNYVATDCTTAILCLGWPDFTAGACRVAVYRSTSNQVWRQELLQTSAVTTAHLGGNPQGTSPLTIVPSPNPTTAPVSGAAWVQSVTLTITPGNTKIKYPAGGAYVPFAAIPVVTDPKAVAPPGASAC
ncbi:MAG TPA: hypothetical protein VN193_14040 [Candidatus Angelobacter sp.]|nr:hypothetical protein [Candidatus Angelobacter sp.]